MKRNPYFDNARLLLIFLVVFGHMIQPYISDSKEINTLYMWIYTFHMPAFILLAGFFAKGFGNKEYIANLAKKLLVPYVIFHVLYSFFYFLIGKDDWYTSIFYPQWSLWFLVSLFCWHILLYWFKKLSPALSITITVLIGLLIGYVDIVGHTFSLSRTFFFFPFFLAGYWLSEKQLMQVKKTSVKALSIVVMLALAIGLYIAPDMNVYWLLGSQSYSQLDLPVFGGLARLLVYVVGTLMMISILAWVPTKHFRITHLGMRTLYVYLLHGFFVQFFRQTGILDVNGFVGLVGIAILSAAIVVLLANKWMVGLWQPVMEGKTTMLRDMRKRKARTDL